MYQLIEPQRMHKKGDYSRGRSPIPPPLFSLSLSSANPAFVDNTIVTESEMNCPDAIGDFEDCVGFPWFGIS